MTPPELRRLWALAGSQEVRSFKDGRRPEVAPCCDVRTLEVTITLADGRRTRITASELGPLSPRLRRLVTLMSRAG
jgi:hypothetical protein